jgi:hypothetical protein
MGLSINNPLGSAIELIKDGLDRFGPADKTVVAQAKAALDQLRESEHAQELDDEFKESLAGLEVVKAEAQGSSWLQRNWRPVTMLTFVGLIVSRMFGWTAPNLSAPEYLELWGLMKLGLGGYVVGRSTEKVVSTAVPAIKAAFSK